MAAQEFGEIPFNSLLALYKRKLDDAGKQSNDQNTLTREETLIQRQKELDKWFKQVGKEEIRKGNIFEKIIFRSPRFVQKVVERYFPFSSIESYYRAKSPFDYPPRKKENGRI